MLPQKDTDVRRVKHVWQLGTSVCLAVADIGSLPGGSRTGSQHTSSADKL